MDIRIATDKASWDQFLSVQRFRPFLQSWTMGEVYRDLHQEPLRLIAYDGDDVCGICQSLIVPARRGAHLSVPYGPIFGNRPDVVAALSKELQSIAKEKGCKFVRISPFWPTSEHCIPSSLPSPLHLLAEHIWYLPLRAHQEWQNEGAKRSEEDILMAMRKTTRNLIRRAEREGVEVRPSDHPTKDLETFLTLHEETRKRHHFTPYTDSFFRAQVEHFTNENQCTLYQAHYQGTVIAASIHMHAFGETSYHHGASTHAFAKIPASYLLQWTAIKDALTRGDHVYNFWGIAPEGTRNHPFKGVTTFKRGFGGKLLELHESRDIPTNPLYYATRTFELFRKWKRGF